MLIMGASYHHRPYNSYIVFKDTVFSISKRDLRSHDKTCFKGSRTDRMFNLQDRDLL